VLDEEARQLHRQIWEMREVRGVGWTAIADRLGVPEHRLATIRLTALELGLAVKEPNGRVTWRSPT
jgi:hypothetical protein